MPDPSRQKKKQSPHRLLQYLYITFLFSSSLAFPFLVRCVNMYLTKKQSKKSCGHWYRSTQGFFFVYGFKNYNKNGPLRSCSDDTSSINIHMCSHLHLHLQAAADCVTSGMVVYRSPLYLIIFSQTV